MKNILLFILLLNANLSYGQITIQNLNLTKPDTNILYIGLENNLTISNIKETHFRIESTSSDIDTNFGRISIYPRFRNYDTLRIFDKKKLILQQVFKLVKLPDPEILVSGRKDSIILKEILLGTPRLNTYLPNCLYIYPYTITSFELNIQKQKNSQITLSATCNEYNIDMKEEIEHLHSGDILIFKNIMAKCPNCRIRRLGDKIIRIK